MSAKSDWPAFDDAAIAAARDTVFRTWTRGCRPVAGSFIFIVTFRRDR